MSTSTPARDAASFPPEPVSARAARAFLRRFLADCGREDLGADAELAVSEVVTNAVLHAHTEVEVVATMGKAGLRVEVTDHNPQLPAQRNYADQATTGRGLDLVEAVTSECGVEPQGSAGKTVWFVVTGGGVATPPGATAHSWAVDLPAVASPEDDGAVVLLAMPATLWLAAREHHDALLRELGLFAVEHPQDAPTKEQFVLADQARGLISVRLAAELSRLSGTTGRHRSLPDGHPSELPDTPSDVDLRFAVPPDVVRAFGVLQDVLDVAEQQARRGLLLARPGLPEIIAVRDWACEQVIAQVSGVAPSPWPGTADERFTEPIDVADAPAFPDWDANEVTASERNLVAVDDANRILAVSPSLARALGWEPDDLVGRRVIVLIPPALREAHVAGFTRHLTTGETQALGVPLVLPVLCADGRIVNADFRVDQIPAQKGRPVYLASIDPIAEPESALA